MASTLESNKRRMIRKYFGLFPTWTWWLLAIGPILFGGSVTALLSLPQGPSRTESLPFFVLGAVAGLIASGVSIVVLLNWPTDQQVDAWLAEDLEYLRENGGTCQ